MKVSVYQIPIPIIADFNISLPVPFPSLSTVLSQPQLVDISSMQTNYKLFDAWAKDGSASVQRRMSDSVLALLIVH